MIVPTPTVTRVRMTASMAYVCSVPIGAGLGAMTDGLMFLGMQISGFIWIGYLAAGVLLLIGRMALAKRIGFALPVAGWVPWAMVVWFSLAWSEQIQLHNVQEAMQLTTPLFVGLLVSSVVRHRWQLTAIFASFVASATLLLLSVPFEWTGLLGVKEQGNRAAALAATLFGCALIALRMRNKAAGIAGWSLCLAVTFVTGSRMATAALLAVPIMHPLVRPTWLRPLAVGALAVVGTALFYSPIFQERFFHTGSGTLTDVANGDMLDFGRLDAWPPLLEQAFRSPFLGWGVGAAYDYVPLVWPRMQQCHNDYLRVFFETGALGLALFFAALIWQFLILRRQVAQQHGRLQDAFAGAYLGLLALLTTSLTDNTLGYNLWFTNSFFVLLGAAHGVAHAESAQSPIPVFRRNVPLAYPAGLSTVSRNLSGGGA